MKPARLRPETFDAAIWKVVNEENEYRLPNAFARGDVVVDVGAHIGAFTYAVLTRGAGRVLAFEPFAENFEMASVNLRTYGNRVTLRNEAVWACSEKLMFQVPTNENTGGGGVWDEGVEVQVVAFDEVCRTAARLNRKGRVRLVKLDCEGSEWAILLTSTMLGVIDEVCGEFHEDRVPPQTRSHTPGPFTRWRLGCVLTKAGFDVRLWVNPGAPTLGLFWARRPEKSPD